MKHLVLAALVLLSACAKVGPPLPPIVRVPQKVETLSVSQSGYNVVLSWTNPAEYIDKNAATDLGKVHIFQNGAEVQTVDAGKAGQPQAVSIDARNSVGKELSFTVQLEVPKAPQPSAISNRTSVRPVDVPGAPLNLRAVVDQGKINLEWDPPKEKPELAKAYLVQRADRPPVRVTETHFGDEQFEAGMTYSYSVTALRSPAPEIPGDGSPSLQVLAKDLAAPRTPTGVRTQLVGTFVFVQWNANTETDLKDYLFGRSDWKEPIHVDRPSYTDEDYMPGKGLYYQVIAVDKSENKSKETAPTPGP